MMDWEMGWHGGWMGLGSLLVLVQLVLAIAALIKVLRG